MARIYSRSGTMSSETKNFIQKICYKKSASIDMTQYGFLKDSKVLLINLMLKPLKEQLEKIWGIKSNCIIKTAKKPSPSRQNEKGQNGSKNKPITHGNFISFDQNRNISFTATPTIKSLKLLKTQKVQKTVKTSTFSHQLKNEMKNKKRC